MKLYVWDNVLTDYTDGIMFAVAPNLEDARRQLRESIGYDHPDIKNEPIEYSGKRRICRTVFGGG